MKNMQNLDKKDREIVHELDLNSRQTNSRIAKKVRLSKEVVGYRIKRMLDEKIIQGFYVIVDMTKLGYLNARIFIKLKNASPALEAEMIGYFERSPRCWWVNSNTGSFTDMGIAFWVTDIKDFRSFKEEILNRYREHIDFYRESFYSNIHIWHRGYLSANSEKKQYELIPGSSRIVEFDNLDIRLLAALSEDARMPLVELAKKTGLSITATKHRMKRLEKSEVILGFRPKINLAKINQYWYKVELQLENNRAKSALLAYFSSHPNIVYAYESIGGGTELEFEMEVESSERFREVVDGVREKFRDSVRTYTYYLWSAEHKIVFFPPLEFFSTGK